MSATGKARGLGCAGSFRCGVMPGATKTAPAEWAAYREGRLRCPYCQAFVQHDAKGRLIGHAR